MHTVFIPSHCVIQFNDTLLTAWEEDVEDDLWNGAQESVPSGTLGRQPLRLLGALAAECLGQRPSTGFSPECASFTLWHRQGKFVRLQGMAVVPSV